MSSILVKLPSVTVYRAKQAGVSVEIASGACVDRALYELAMELVRVQALLTDETARCCDAQMALDAIRGIGIDLSEGP